jgi:hypothetical protein
MGSHTPAGLFAKWSVASAGYELVAFDGEPWITARDDVRRWYYPTEEPPRGALHRRFADLYKHVADDLREFETAVLAFASQYGLLGGIGREIEIPERGARYAEPFDAWLWLCGEFRTLVTLHDTMNRGTLDELNAVIAEHGWGRPVETVVDPSGASIVTAVEETEDVVLPLTTRKEARHRICQYVVALTGGLLAGAADVFTENPIALPLPALHGEKIVFRSHATCLTGFLLLEFACSLDRDIEERRCETCGAEFIIDPTQRMRSTRRYCSQRCRNAAHEAKVRQAKALRADGVPLAEIAKQLRTKTQTVRGWIKAAAKRRH